MYSDILGKVRTKQESNRLEEEVELLIVSLYKTGKEDYGKAASSAYESVLKESVRSWVADEIRTDLERESISKTDYLKGLKKRLGKLKIVKLTVAFEPTEGGLGKIQNWIQTNLGEGVISDLSYNTRLLAGAVVIYQGKYADLSLKNKFKDIFEGKRREILGLLNNKDRLSGDQETSGRAPGNQDIG